jgi:pimeloyl-ACP methyl ester carboxylesterase
MTAMERNSLRPKLADLRLMRSRIADVGVSIPVAVSVFPDELYPAPRSWAERVYPKLIHYNKVEKGGHFAAWELPQLFSQEVRAGFRQLRT